jgi:glycosyltransferase involved in cell wall biosynthesis
LLARLARLLRREPPADAAHQIETQEWLAAYLQDQTAVLPPAAALPLVSIVLPTWNRAASVVAAVDSVRAQGYARWELVVVDDGGTDETRERLGSRLDDPRVRYVTQPHAGVAAARNHGLRLANGDVVAYVDSDTTWSPNHLAAVVRTLTTRPACDAVYTAQLVSGPNGAPPWVRYRPFDATALAEENYIDLNAFAHRRALAERIGGFDERLTRLVDWDFILRCAAAGTIEASPQLGSCYHNGAWPRITNREPLWRNHYLVRRKLPSPLRRPLRVLYAAWHFPQLSESYVRWEIACMRRFGVDVEVWSEVDAAGTPYPTDVTVHHGSLAAAIARARPDVVHGHWLHSALQYADAVAASERAMTVRGHGFEFDRSVVRRLLAHPAVAAVYLFPHYAAYFRRNPKLRAMPSCFDGDLYHPEEAKDPRLVIRTGAALATKDYELFFDVAAACPRHTFVLAIVRCLQVEEQVERILALNERSGGRVDVRVNVPTEELAALVRRAGIHLHTHGTSAPFGMPISIAETMATGCLTLVRDLPGAAEYVGSAGLVYRSAAEAIAAIHATEEWTPERWAAARSAAVEHAYERFSDVRVLPPLLDEWQRLAARHASRP